jgi:hypothetical protein
MQLLAIQFKIKMFHIGFMQVLILCVKKVKQSRYRPGVAQRVPVKQCRYRPGVAQRVPGS